MNSTDSKHLIDYFRNKKGKHLKLYNGERVELKMVFANLHTLSLTFTQDNREIYISFDGLYGEYITMNIPDGLQEGVSISPTVKFGSLQSIEFPIEKILVNWTERRDEFIELDWEDVVIKDDWLPGDDIEAYGEWFTLVVEESSYYAEKNNYQAYRVLDKNFSLSDRMTFDVLKNNYTNASLEKRLK